jgi:hypothetical protein
VILKGGVYSKVNHSLRFVVFCFPQLLKANHELKTQDYSLRLPSGTQARDPEGRGLNKSQPMRCMGVFLFPLRSKAS